MVKKQNKKIKVLVALSGGVDSSVAAALLVKQGYAVTAAYMVNYDQSSPTGLRLASSPDSLRLQGIAPQSGATPCWVPDYRDALRVAAHLNIPMLKLDFTKEYKAKVLDYMFAEYEKGRTPNPDVLCNKYIKFGVWLDHAHKLGFDYLATGHYARLEPGISNIKYQILNKNKNYKLFEAKDKNKDQTYFLHQLNQEQLSHTMFPIGEHTKPQVRKIAEKLKLPTASKEESMGICFVGEVPMKEFLETRIKPKLGNIILSPSLVGAYSYTPSPIGSHDGLAFYTIGQRHALHLLFRPSDSNERVEGSLDVARDDNKPLYVVGKKLETNELVVGYENDPLLYSTEITVSEVNWTSGQPPKFPLKCEVRLRHRQELQKCVVNCHSEQSAAQSRNLATITVTFSKPQRAVTPGQFAVFYLPRRSSKKAKVGEVECLGGGVIE